MGKKAASLLLLVLTVSGEGASLEPSEFRIIADSFSDNGGTSIVYLLDVKPDAADGSVVQLTRISAAHEACPRKIVETAEALVPKSNPAALARGANLCTMRPAAFESTLREYLTRPGHVFEHVTFEIAARCGGSLNTLRLPIAQHLQMEALRLEHPAIVQLWDLFMRVKSEVFGANSRPFDRSADPLLQERGAMIVTAMGLRSELADYSGPMSVEDLSRDPFVPELRDAKAFQFRRYVEPAIKPMLPPAAYARPVELQLTVNPKTGEVLRVREISGHLRLSPYVVEAARQWQFVPQSLRSRTLRVTMAFHRYCP